jgi:hypothetical protein
MISLEVRPGVSDQFSVGWVVDCLDASDFGLQRWQMLFDVFDQSGLGIGGAGDQHGASIGDGLRNMLQIGMILRRVATADTVGLVVYMARRMIWLEDETIDFGTVEMKDPGFMMIDPDDRVSVVRHGGLQSRSTSGVWLANGRDGFQRGGRKFLLGGVGSRVGLDEPQLLIDTACYLRE